MDVVGAMGVRAEIVFWIMSVHIARDVVKENYCTPFSVAQFSSLFVYDARICA